MFIFCEQVCGRAGKWGRSSGMRLLSRTVDGWLSLGRLIAANRGEAGTGGTLCWRILGTRFANAALGPAGSGNSPQISELTFVWIPTYRLRRGKLCHIGHRDLCRSHLKNRACFLPPSTGRGLGTAALEAYASDRRSLS